MTRALLRFGVEAQSGEDFGRAGMRRVRADVGEANLDFGNAMRVGRGFSLCQQIVALAVGGQHPFDKRRVASWRFLRHMADARALGQADPAVVGCEIAGDELQQGGLAGAIAADETDLVAGGDRRRRRIENEPAFDAKGDVVDVEHDGWA